MKTLKVIKRKRKFQKLPGGFTFVEILVTLVIIQVLAVSLMMMFSFTYRSNAVNEDSLLVSTLMQWKIEELKAYDFTRDVSIVNDTIPPYSKYQFDVNQSTPFDGSPNLKRIEVICRWINPWGNVRIKSIRFLVANY